MADKDFVVKNGLVVNTNVLVVNGSNVGINTTTPDAVFTVNGTANIAGNAAFLGNTIQIDGTRIPKKRKQSGRIIAKL